MNKICQLLDFDADVLLFNKDTYIVSRFKELISENFRQKFCTRLTEHHADFSVSGLFNKLCINEVNFKVEDITWQSCSEGINCQVFRVGSTGWQVGKLRIKVSTEIISPLAQREGANMKITVVLEFYPENSNEPESPLDDLRQMIQAT
ncbi:KGK domain-containing protein [Nostoc sp. 'Peltigera membranacea cyanobiont' N6]|uniref:KGK domain-containing protein n=1 Tax=Nostoc sp. 'Peltigera membranacea cyanobiont' N6 TaxID=1261031 RepID=UPI000CF355DC|nr:KGK domain-containing protein [Nostoc sp. 'Peltigera membranacea cyanobiont' N6]AVH67847.1 KGK family protein [Nostoc sp. 'Peltigera membranacea cyanobiont' N6]